MSRHLAEQTLLSLPLPVPSDPSSSCSSKRSSMRVLSSVRTVLQGVLKSLLTASRWLSGRPSGSRAAKSTLSLSGLSGRSETRQALGSSHYSSVSKFGWTMILCLKRKSGSAALSSSEETESLMLRRLCPSGCEFPMTKPLKSEGQPLAANPELTARSPGEDPGRAHD